MVRRCQSTVNTAAKTFPTPVCCIAAHPLRCCNAVVTPAQTGSRLKTGQEPLFLGGFRDSNGIHAADPRYLHHCGGSKGNQSLVSSTR
jgi:hypothetical protein